MVAAPIDILSKVRKLCDVKGIPIKARDRVGVFSCFGDGAEVKSAGDTKNDLMIRFMLTTSDLDMDGERILPDGLDVDTYLMRVRSWFVDHEYDALRKIGSIRDMRRRGNGWETDVVMLNRDTNPYTQAVIAWAEEGQCPCSIGYEEIDASAPAGTEIKQYPDTRRLVRKSMALEGSSTALPCNATCNGAVVYGKSYEEKRAGLREILVKSKASAEVIRAMVPEDKPQRRVMVLG